MQTGSRFRVRRAAGAVQTDCYEARTDARQAAPFRCFGRHFYGPSVLRHRNAAALSIDPDRRCHILVTECGCAWDRGKPLPFGAARGAIMGNVVNDFLLFSCMALFVTGIVLAAASLLI